MIEKPLILLSILASIVGFSPAANRYDQAIAKIESGNYTQASASINPSDLGYPEIIKSPRVKTFSEKPVINSLHYLLGDMASGKILIRQAAADKVPIASTTKIMTAVVALENYKLDDVVTIPASSTSQNPMIVPTIVNLRAGEKITVRELLHCVLIQSGNDAAFATASHLSPDGNIEPFVALMNKKAAELGMDSTKYLDPAGLDDNGYSSAEDLFTITRYALKNPVFKQITSTPTYIAHNTNSTISHQLANSNRLVNGYSYIGAIGIKTGFTEKAGHCLVSAVEREGHVFIGVVLNTFSTTATASADESRKLQDWAWENIEWK